MARLSLFDLVRKPQCVYCSLLEASGDTAPSCLVPIFLGDSACGRVPVTRGKA